MTTMPAATECDLPRLHLVGIFHTQHAAIAMTLVSEELITTVQGVAGEYDLPQEFIGALVPLSPV